MCTFLLCSEIAKDEEILKDYKRYKNLLFMLSPPQWQEAQEVKAMRAKAQRDTDAQQVHKDTEESAGTWVTMWQSINLSCSYNILAW